MIKEKHGERERERWRMTEREREVCVRTWTAVSPSFPNSVH